MPRIEVGKVVYNPGAAAFQARVDIVTNNRSYRYPCEVAGPLDMNMSDVRTRLARQAVAMSDSGVGLLSSV